MVVASGLTFFELAPRTEPTPLSIERAVGAPPESVHDNVANSPFVMVAGSAENESIIGRGVLTAIVIDHAAVPEMFLAVNV